MHSPTFKISSRIARTSVAIAAAFALAACTASGTTGDADPTTSSNGSNTALSMDSDLHALLPEDIQQSGKLLIGSPMSSPPLLFTDNGKPTGIAYDLSVDLGTILGVSVEWQDMAFPGVIPGLQGGNIDLSMGVIGDTAERQKVLDFVDLFKNESSLLTQKGNPKQVTDLDSVCGLTIGSQTGSLQLVRLHSASDACVAAGKPAVTINEYTSQADGQAAVQSERIAAYYAPYLTLNYVARTAGNGQIFEMGTGRYPDNPFAIAMQKDRGSLAKAVQGALLQLVQSGRYLEIMQAYGSEAAAVDASQVLINGAGTDAFPLD